MSPELIKERTKYYLEAYLITNQDVLEPEEVVELEELISHNAE